MAFHFLGATSHTLDAARAAQLDALPRYAGQRPLRPVSLEAIKAKYELGQFLVANTAIAVCTYDHNREVLVNGSHSVQVVLQNPGIVLPEVCGRYSVDSLDDLGTLYVQFDNGLGIKSGADFARDSLVRIGKHNVWGRRTGSLMVAATYWLASRHQSALARDMRAAHLTAAQIPVGDFIDTKVRAQGSEPLINRIPVAAAVIRSWEIDQDDSYAFWTAVLDNVELVQESPRWRLNRFLSTPGRYMRVGKRASSSGKPMGVRDRTATMWNWCAAAWNAERTGARRCVVPAAKQADGSLAYLAMV